MPHNGHGFVEEGLALDDLRVGPELFLEWRKRSSGTRRAARDLQLGYRRSAATTAEKFFKELTLRVREYRALHPFRPQPLGLARAPTVMETKLHVPF